MSDPAQELRLNTASTKKSIIEQYRRLLDAFQKRVADAEEARKQLSVSEERDREESEYLYERDRSRKLEEHAYIERKEALEKELEQLQESTRRELAEREAAVKTGEDELKKLNDAIDTARREAATEVTKDCEQKAQLVAVEREGEAKMAAQRIEHLEALIAAQEEKLNHLRSELAGAQKQVNEVAKKAIEGASLTKAFQSVNQIALEQARKPDAKGGEQDRAGPGRRVHAPRQRRSGPPPRTPGPGW